MAKRSSQKLVNELIDKKIHPITGWLHREKYIEAALKTHRVRRTKRQAAIITKAKSLSMKRLHGSATQEEIDWLENYKINKKEILKQNK